MWGWFGGAAAQKRKDAPKNAILQLRGTLDMLQKRERHLESQMAEQEAVARRNINSNKTG
jgi:charged multivesicular body protein 4A/B